MKIFRITITKLTPSLCWLVLSNSLYSLAYCSFFRIKSPIILLSSTESSLSEIFSCNKCNLCSWLQQDSWFQLYICLARWLSFFISLNLPANYEQLECQMMSTHFIKSGCVNQESRKRKGFHPQLLDWSPKRSWQWSHNPLGRRLSIKPKKLQMASWGRESTINSTHICPTIPCVSISVRGYSIKPHSSKNDRKALVHAILTYLLFFFFFFYDE